MIIKPMATGIKEHFTPAKPYIMYNSPGPGRVGTEVRAPISGVIRNVVTSRNPGQPSERGKTVRGGVSGNGFEIVHKSRERAVLAHLKLRADLKAGDRVDAGEVVGYTDRSGILPSGPGLFFGAVDAAGRPLDPENWEPGEGEESLEPEISGLGDPPAGEDPGAEVMEGEDVSAPSSDDTEEA